MNFFIECKNTSKNNLKINTHFSIQIILESLQDRFRASERLNIYSDWESGVNFTKKSEQRSLMNMDKDSGQENAQKVNL